MSIFWCLTYTYSRLKLLKVTKIVLNTMSNFHFSENINLQFFLMFRNRALCFMRILRLLKKLFDWQGWQYGTPQFLLRSTVRLYDTRSFYWYEYGTSVRCLNLRSKCTIRIVLIGIGTVRFMCNLRPSMKIRATVYIQLKIHNTAPVARTYLCPDFI